jgi:phosphoglycerate dehydrogenase-like enzyme
VADLRIVITNPLPAEEVDLLARLEPRLEVVYPAELLGPVDILVGHNDPDFRRTPTQQAEYEELVDSADALFGVPEQSGRALARTVAANPRLRWVHTIPAGGGQQVKSARLAPADLERIVFTTSAGVHADALAEFAVFGILAGAQHLGRLRSDQARHVWGDYRVVGSVRASTVLVVGLGSIGRATAAKLAALGARVVGIHRRDVDVAGVAEVRPVEEFADAAATADAIVMALPGTEQTERMLGSEVFSALRPGTTVVNVGRGTTIDEPALIDALRAGRVGTAVLDVAAVEPLPEDSPLWDLPGVLISPHTAALAGNEARGVTELVAENARRLLDGEPLRNVVDTVEFY